MTTLKPGDRVEIVAIAAAAWGVAATLFLFAFLVGRFVIALGYHIQGSF